MVGRAGSSERQGDRAVGLWLLGVAAMVFVMALIGAITRLTESGLSIMEWAPVKGALPPLDEAEWRRLFALYRETGEYAQLGGGMDLAGFQRIFWWEWIHRFWGRIIGLAFAFPALWFALRGRLVGRLRGQVWVLAAIGGLQAWVGWYMVASGFSARTDVSHLRLLAHLGLALTIYALLIRAALGQLLPRGGPPGDARLLRALLALLAVTVASGALVAGLNAGLVFDTFPLMGGRLWPQGVGALTPWWANLIDNQVTVHADHRALATVTSALAVASAVVGLRAGPDLALRRALWAVVACVGAQYCLGVLTVILHVPVALGVLHQAGAIALLTAVLVALHLSTAEA